MDWNWDYIPTSCDTSYNIFKLDCCPNIEDFYRAKLFSTQIFLFFVRKSDSITKLL